MIVNIILELTMINPDHAGETRYFLIILEHTMINCDHIGWARHLLDHSNGLCLYHDQA